MEQFWETPFEMYSICSFRIIFAQKFKNKLENARRVIEDSKNFENLWLLIKQVQNSPKI